MVGAEFITALRRMVAEPTQTNYPDAVLSDYIEAWAVRDADGLKPTDTGWTPTYDLPAAAADVWEEKGAAAVGNFDFSADGGSFSRNQVHQQCMQMARHYKSRASVRTLRSVVDPGEPEGS